jgi:SAM-dependent methyltransferase
MKVRLEFSDVLSAVEQAERNYEMQPLSTEISPNDDMIVAGADWEWERRHYFSVGANALEIVFEAMILCRVAKFESILDVPSGFGRVTRHLRAAFPDATLYASDLYQNRIDFCAQALGARPVKSKEDFAQIVYPTRFDLIWCGSLLTHLAASEFQSALDLCSRSLNPDGVAIVTLHGRHSPYFHHNRCKYLPDKSFALAERGFRKAGFGYADYNMPGVYSEQKAYGISLSAPSYVLKCLEKDESLRVKAYIERHWDDHQDVVIVQKTPINL